MPNYHNPRKLTASDITRINEFVSIADPNGIMYLSGWTTGKGRYTQARQLPPFCCRIDRVYLESYLRGKRRDRRKFTDHDRAVRDWFDANPRCKACLVIDLEAWRACIAAALRGYEVPADIALTDDDREKAENEARAREIDEHNAREARRQQINRERRLAD